MDKNLVPFWEQTYQDEKQRNKGLWTRLYIGIFK